MSKLLKSFILIFIIGFGGYLSFKNTSLFNNTNNVKSSNIKEVSNNEHNSSSSDDKYSKPNESTSNNEIVVNDNNDKFKDSNTTKSNEDYSVLVSMKGYNAKVSLDYSAKEIKISSINKDSKPLNSNTNYLSVSDEDIDYLTENIDILKKQFESSNIFEKYTMLDEILKKFDTNIKKSDIINIAFRYLS